MAVTPQNNDAFFREVDEELRRDQVGQFWQRWGKLLLVAGVVALVLLAGFLWWQHTRTQAAERESETLVTALETASRGKPQSVRPAIEGLKDSKSPGYRAAARLSLAALALERKDVAGATALYKSVSDDAALPDPYRQLALIRATTIAFDTLPPAEVIARLKPLAVAGNPWFGSAGELTAMAHLKMNRADLAGPLFGAIAKDPDVPESLRSRATQMAGALGVSVVTTEGSK